MASARRIAFNLFSFLPGSGALPFVRRTLERRALGTGGTISARYCYSVWLRHLIHVNGVGLGANPRTVAELGPGDSLGVGIAALLTGAERYFAFDVVRHAVVERNLEIFYGIRDLVLSRSPIPDNEEFPEVRPTLDDWSFPSHILTEQRLTNALCSDRLRSIERSIQSPSGIGSAILYKVPWLVDDIIEAGSVDMIFSQAALEHVDDLAGAYKAMSMWLREGGTMSHVVDFRSHGWADEWNGHWAISELAWKVIRGKDVWAINREPLSEHLNQLVTNGFRLVGCQSDSMPSAIPRRRLARRFRRISDIDLRTPGALLLSRKTGNP